jgi:hypothetical protein
MLRTAIHLGTEKPECACGCKVDSAASAPVDPEAGAPASASDPKTPGDPCQCADPKSDCYKDHYAGVCGCKCDDSRCVMLALLTYDTNKQAWIVDYRVRRFIRPVLMRDPLAVDPAAQSNSSTSSVMAKETAAKETIAKKAVAKKAVAKKNRT